MKSEKCHNLKVRKTNFRQRVEVMVKDLEALVNPPDPPTTLATISSIVLIIIFGLIFIYVWYVIFDYFSETHIPATTYCNCGCCCTQEIQIPFKTPSEVSNSYRFKFEENFKHCFYVLQNLYVVITEALMFCADYGIPFCAFGDFGAKILKQNLILTFYLIFAILLHVTN